MEFDVIIVGAGSAGLFAAKEIAERSNLRILVVDQGLDVEKRVCPVATSYKLCTRCLPCHIMCGVGGSGLLSSGILNFRSDVGGNLAEIAGSERRAQAFIRKIEEAFLLYGAPYEEVYEASPSEIEELERKAAAVGVKFVPIRQRLIGSDNAPRVIENFKRDLVKKGVEFKTQARVNHVDSGIVTLSDGETLRSKYVIAAPGRSGSDWLANESKRLGIPMRYGPVDVGVRVEVPAVIMKPIIKVSRDPKFHVHSTTYDDFVRTFCVNHEGFVVQEVYEDFVSVNGHCLTSRKSENTNFALLVRIQLTQPLEDSTLYGRTIAIQATTLGGGKPIIQRLGDLVHGHRSSWDRIKRGAVQPTLTNLTPGDIGMAMPHRIVTDIIECLQKLDHVIPGVASHSTLLYAPEIKFSANRIFTNENLETPVKNLFIAGDGAGLSRGIVAAAVTGLVAAQGILKKEGIEIPLL